MVPSSRHVLLIIQHRLLILFDVQFPETKVAHAVLMMMTVQQVCTTISSPASTLTSPANVVVMAKLAFACPTTCPIPRHVLLARFPNARLAPA